MPFLFESLLLCNPGAAIVEECVANCDTFMSSGEINREALREIYPTRQEGCFVRKPVTIDYLLKRIMSELD